MQRRATIGWLLLFLPVTALFYWKIVLTRQFSLLTDSEAVNQGYSWLQFAITTIRQVVATGHVLAEAVLCVAEFWAAGSFCPFDRKKEF